MPSGAHDFDDSDDTDNFDEFYNMGLNPGKRNNNLEKFDQNVRKFHNDFEHGNEYEYRGGQNQPNKELNRVSYKFIDYI